MKIVNRKVKDFESKMNEFENEYIAEQVASLARTVKRYQDKIKLVKFLSKFISIEVKGRWEISYLTIKCDKRQAKRVLRQLMQVGVKFGEASYELSAYDKGPKGDDMVYVCRTMSEIPGFDKQLVEDCSIRWLAPYKGGHQCKIVETVSPATTYRSLVCSKTDVR